MRNSCRGLPAGYTICRMEWIWNIALLAHQGHDHGGDTSSNALADISPTTWIILGVGVVAAVGVLLFIVSKLRGGKAPAAAVTEPPDIQLASLPAGPPPAGGAQLEVYNMPMRLALLVLAPVGREGQIPPNEQLPQVVDSIAPNLMQVLNDQQPEFRRWPPQLSSQGFSQIFFNKVQLPGDAGKNTPWCALAGRFDTPAGPCLAGLVCLADKANSLGQVAVAQSGQWLDILRVKT